MHAAGSLDLTLLWCTRRSPVDVGGRVRPNRADCSLLSPTGPRTILVCLGLEELGAKHSDFVDELSDHLCSHRLFAPEPLRVVERSEPLLG